MCAVTGSSRGLERSGGATSKVKLTSEFAGVPFHAASTFPFADPAGRNPLSGCDGTSNADAVSATLVFPPFSVKVSPPQSQGDLLFSILPSPVAAEECYATSYRPAHRR